MQTLKINFILIFPVCKFYLTWYFIHCSGRKVHHYDIDNWILYSANITDQSMTIWYNNNHSFQKSKCLNWFITTDLAQEAFTCIMCPIWLNCKNMICQQAIKIWQWLVEFYNAKCQHNNTCNIACSETK